MVNGQCETATNADEATLVSDFPVNARPRSQPQPQTQPLLPMNSPSPRAARSGGRPIVGTSEPMRLLRLQLQQVGRSRATVLLTGETGTGKGHAARYLHEQSAECEEPFVHVDCASLAATVIESELFGHERGAFTGAHERRRGRFERAGKGTIFLDEIAEVATPLQAKLLRVLEDREFERVGGGTSLPLRARVVAATNRDLASEIEAGRFREDLFYRLQVFEVRLTPLRERRSDIPDLIEAEIARRTPRGAASVVATRAFAERLETHAWQGNVRELLNVLERVSISNPDGPWDARDAELALGAFAPSAPARAGSESGAWGGDGRGAGRGQRAGSVGIDSAFVSRDSFAATERFELAQALRLHRWNVSAAARSLGLSRGAMRGRMARLGLR